MLKPQDVVVLLKIVARGGEPWSYSLLAWELGMSASEVHAAIRRSAEAGLFRADRGWGAPDCEALEEFLVHGLRYVWPPVRGGLVHGVPTLTAAAPLAGLVAPGEDPPAVWPHPGEAVRGLALEPLYKSVPVAARRDPRLHELLVLVDAIRGARGTVRDLAIGELRARLGTSEAGTLSEQARVPPGQDARDANTHEGHHGKERQRLHR